MRWHGESESDTIPNNDLMENRINIVDCIKIHIISALEILKNSVHLFSTSLWLPYVMILINVLKIGQVTKTAQYVGGQESKLVNVEAFKLDQLHPS